MTKYIRLIPCFLLLGFGLNAQHLASNQVSAVDNQLGHLECVIHADTNCVTQAVTLEAWLYYTFTGLSVPVTVPWSTGETAHKIVVTPPGIWSWDSNNQGCDHYFNEISIEKPFFDAAISIQGQPAPCPFENVFLTVDTMGYAFTDFNWSSNYPVLSPLPVAGPGDYSLTVTDALGCTATDAYFTPILNEDNESCGGACVFCNLDGYQGNNDVAIVDANTTCPDITINNDVWFGFVAGTDTISFEVLPSNCQNGTGLQLLLKEDCNSPDLLECNGGCNSCADTPLFISYPNFVPGQTYWLMVDGYLSDVCDFQINVIKGNTIAPAPAQPAQPQGPASVCANFTAEYSVPAVFGASYYHWTAPAGAMINGLSNDEIIAGASGASVTVTFAAAGGDICVQAGNACFEPSTSACLSVGLNGFPATEKARLELCENDLPYLWDEAPFTNITSPGTYILFSTPYTSSLGCDSIVKQEIIVYANKLTLLAPVYRCAGDCFEVGGMPICDAGTYAITVDSYRGCDSTITFSFTVLNPIADIQGPSQISCDESNVVLQSVASGGDKVWTDTTGAILGTGDMLNISESGIYILTTSITAGNFTCSVSDTAMFEPNSTILEIIIEGAFAGCETDSLVLSATASNSNAQYMWTGPNGFSSSEQYPVIEETGVYTVVATSPGGCQGTATATVPVIGGAPDVLALGDSIDCQHLNGQLSGVSAVGVSFAWTGPSGFQSTEQNPLVSEAGAYLLIVAGPNGCTAHDTAYLVSNIEIITVDIEPATVLCAMAPQLICTTNSASPSFQWTGPGGFNATIQNPIAPLSGQYVVLVDNGFGCTASSTVLVDSIDVIPDVFAESDTLPCGVLSVQINAGSNTSGATFSWTGPNNFQSDEASPTVTESGTYTLTVTNPEGCTNTATVEMFVTGPNPMVETPGAMIICTTYPMLVAVTDAANPTYAWEGPANFQSTEPQPTVILPGMYSLTMTDQSSGCTAISTAEVVENNADIVIVSSGINEPLNGTNNGSISISVQSSSDSLTYSWYLDSLPISNDQNILGLGPGTYTVIIIDEFGCSIEATWVLNGVSGTSTTLDKKGWQVRPNPGAGYFEIVRDGAQGATNLRVFNMDGRLVIQGEMAANENRTPLDLTNMPTGGYVLELRNAASFTRIKLIVQR